LNRNLYLQNALSFIRRIGPLFTDQSHRLHVHWRQPMPDWARQMFVALSGSGFAPVSILLNLDWHMVSVPLRAMLGSAMASACQNLSVIFDTYPRDQMETILDWLHRPLQQPRPQGTGGNDGGRSRVLMLRHFRDFIDIHSFIEALIRVIINSSQWHFLSDR
jgi:hypothetical protein